jgi:hypothetical protein
MQFLQEWSERDRGLALALHEYELTTVLQRLYASGGDAFGTIRRKGGR